MNESLCTVARPHLYNRPGKCCVTSSTWWREHEQPTDERLFWSISSLAALWSCLSINRIRSQKYSIFSNWNEVTVEPENETAINLMTVCQTNKHPDRSDELPTCMERDTTSLEILSFAQSTWPRPPSCSDGLKPPDWIHSSHHCLMQLGKNRKQCLFYPNQAVQQFFATASITNLRHFGNLWDPQDLWQIEPKFTRAKQTL